MKLKFLRLIIFLCTLHVVYAQEQLSLEMAKSLLNANNSNIKQAALREKLAQIDLYQAYDALLPNLGFSLNNQHTMGLNFDQITGQLIMGNQWTHYANGTLSSSVTLFQGFKALNTIRLNKISAELSKLDTDKLKYELQVQLVNLFYQSLINYDLYQASEAQAKLSSQLVETEQTKMEFGKSTVLDLAQAKNKLANDELNTTNAKNAYDLSLFKLKQILELDKQQTLELIKPTRQLENSTEVNQLDIYQASVNDPYIKIANRRIDQALTNVRIAKSGYYPRVDLNGGYGTNYSSRRFSNVYTQRTMPVLEQMNKNRSLYFNFVLSYPIFDRFNTKSNVSKTNIALENMRLEKDKTLREREQSYQQAKLELDAAQQENKAIVIAYESNKLNYEAMQERFHVGKNSSIDLFKAMTDFNMVEFRKIISKYNVSLKQEILKMQMQYE